jgi:hypothetical protein
MSWKGSWMIARTTGSCPVANAADVPSFSHPFSCTIASTPLLSQNISRRLMLPSLLRAGIESQLPSKLCCWLAAGCPPSSLERRCGDRLDDAAMAKGLQVQSERASSSADAVRGLLVRARLSPSGWLVVVADGDLLYRCMAR